MMPMPSHHPPPSTPKLMTVTEENRHCLRVFINTYRDLPVLWDTSLRDYTNRDKRAEAYEQLVPIYRYLKRDANVEDVKKKINTLRTNYRKELKVVESARRTGTVHHPRCWTFHELDFLRNTEKFLAVNPKSEPFTFNDSSQSQASFMDAPSFLRSMMSNSPVQSPPSITEMFHKSFGHAHKMEPHQTPPPPPTQQQQGGGGGATPYHAPQHDATSQAVPPPVHKRQRLSPSAAAAVSGQQQNPDELLNIACDYLSGTFPEEESIARTWTFKLKRMQREQRLLAEKFINDILFEGESGTLHRGSIQINAFEPYVRFEEQSNEEHAKSQSPSVHTSSTAATTTTPLSHEVPDGKNNLHSNENTSENNINTNNNNNNTNSNANSANNSNNTGNFGNYN